MKIKQLNHLNLVEVDHEHAEERLTERRLSHQLGDYLDQTLISDIILLLNTRLLSNMPPLTLLNDSKWLHNPKLNSLILYEEKGQHLPNGTDSLLKSLNLHIEIVANRNEALKIGGTLAQNMPKPTIVSADDFSKPLRDNTLTIANTFSPPSLPRPNALFSPAHILTIEIKNAIDNRPHFIYADPNNTLILGRQDPQAQNAVDIDLVRFGGYRMGVSRTHLLINPPQDQIISVVDLGSSYGTFLNEKQLVARSPHPVASGDRLRLGKLEIALHFIPRDMLQRPAQQE